MGFYQSHKTLKQLREPGIYPASDDLTMLGQVKPGKFDNSDCRRKHVPLSYMAYQTNINGQIHERMHAWVFL